MNLHKICVYGATVLYSFQKKKEKEKVIKTKPEACNLKPTKWDERSKRETTFKYVIRKQFAILKSAYPIIKGKKSTP